MANYLNTNYPYLQYNETRNGKVFVDKTLMIKEVSEKIHTPYKYICITRPRRFGKTVNANMLGAYFTKGVDGYRIFDGLMVSQTESYKNHLNQYNVIYMDCSKRPDICFTYQDYITSVLRKLRSDLIEAFPELNNGEYDSVSDMFRAVGTSFIFILDEWDFIFYQDYITETDRKMYLSFLRGLLKDQPYVALAYMTGVRPIVKYSSGSDLNMFREYNFMSGSVYDAYFGFLNDEVRVLAEKHNTISYEELEDWYDGYCLSDGKHLFNPRSVSFALMEGKCENYWTETGPMNEIADCIEYNVDEVREDIVKMVADIPISAKLNSYSAANPRMDNRDEILSAMVVYGFLSYYDGELRIPNFELMEKYEAVLSRKSMGEVKQVVDQSKEMLKATLEQDAEKVAVILEDVHDREIPFLEYKDENSMSCVITLCYLSARDEYRIEREAKSGKGYCDYLFTPRNSGKPAIILELKVGKSCEEAIEQIKKKNYIQKVQHIKEVLLVGINFDKQKHHECRIEKIRNIS